MFPPIFQVLFASSAVKAIFGSSPLRTYAFGDSPAKGAPGYQVPYAIFQGVYGSPENNLTTVPNMDQFGVQLDIYALTLTDARNGAKAIRNALEPVCYVTSWDGETRDEATQLFRYTFTVSFLTPR